MSASAIPYRRSQPSWSKTTPEEVCEHIFRLARRGLSPSQIGVILRDSQGVPQVKFITGNKILRILKTNGESRIWTSGRKTGQEREQSVQDVGIGGEVSSVDGWTGISKRRWRLTHPGLAPSIPEDLYHLIKKAVSVRKHLERNRGDKDAKL